MRDEKEKGKGKERVPLSIFQLIALGWDQQVLSYYMLD